MSNNTGFDSTNSTNVVAIKGEVAGSYPSKFGGGGSYRLIFYTLIPTNRGRPKISKSSVFVRTDEELPNQNSIVSMRGALNVYSTKGDDGVWVTQVSVYESSREVLQEGPPQRTQQKSQPKKQYNETPTNRKPAPAKNFEQVTDDLLGAEDIDW